MANNNDGSQRRFNCAKTGAVAVASSVLLGPVGLIVGGIFLGIAAVCKNEDFKDDDGPGEYTGD